MMQMQDMYEIVERQKEIYDSVDEYAALAEILPEYNIPLKKLDGQVVWMYWNDKRLIPKIVKRCIESVQRHVKRDVVLLTENTVREYVNLPVFVWEKYKNDVITPTHFSDILRVALLTVYGGTWIDATVYLTGDIPKRYLDCELCMVRGDTWRQYKIQKFICCSSWYISACPGNEFITAVRNALYGYWTKEDELKEYFLIHIFIARLLDENADYKRQWINMPFLSSQNTHYLNSMQHQKFDDIKWNEIKEVSFMHKLSYKTKADDYECYYKKIMRNEIG